MSRESDYEAGKALCPFYKGSSAKEHYIRCEGIGCAVSLKLNYSGRERQRLNQLESRCFSDYPDCEVCQAIERKYV